MGFGGLAGGGDEAETTASGEGETSGDIRFQALGAKVEYTDWSLGTGQAVTLHASTNRRGIPFENDGTHMEIGIDFKTSSGTSGETLYIEYSMDRGGTWHNFLDEDGNDETVTAGTAERWTKRFTREFMSEADSTWNIMETHTAYIRITTVGTLAGTIDWDYTEEDDSKTTRSYVETVFSTETQLTGRSYSTNGSTYAVTQINLTPVPFEKVQELVVIWDQVGTHAEYTLRLNRAQIDWMGTYDAGSEPSVFDTEPLKVAMISAPVAYAFDGPFLIPPVSWINSSRAGPHSTVKHRQLIGIVRDGAYITKLLACVIQQDRLLKRVDVVREK